MGTTITDHTLRVLVGDDWSRTVSVTGAF